MAVNEQGQFIETDKVKRSSAGFPEMDGLAAYVASLRTGQEAGGDGGYRPGLGASGIVNVPQEQYPAAEPNLIPTDPIEEVDTLDDVAELYDDKNTVPYELKPDGVVTEKGSPLKAITSKDPTEKESELAKLKERFDSANKSYKYYNDAKDAYEKSDKSTDFATFGQEFYPEGLNMGKRGYGIPFSDLLRTSNNGEDLKTYRDNAEAFYLDEFDAQNGGAKQVNFKIGDPRRNKENIVPFAEVHQSHKDRHGDKFNNVMKNANALNENVIQIESDGVVGAKNKKSTASGLYQFVKDTFATAKKGYAIRHPEDTKIKNAKSAADLSATEQKNLYMDYLLTAKGSDKMLQGNMGKKDQLFWYGHKHHTKPDDATWERAFKQIYKGSVNAKLTESEKTKMRGLAQSFRNKYGKNAWGVK